MLRRDRPAAPRVEIVEAPLIVAEGFELGGRLTLTRPAIVNGKLRGEIESTSNVVVGPTGVVHARIQARTVTVRGEVVGAITATECIELETGARVLGDLAAPRIAIEPAVSFEGRCDMAAAPVDRRPQEMQEGAPEGRRA